MSGAFDWLDNLTTQVGNIAGKAVDAVGNVAQAAETAKAQTDQAAVRPAASAQVSLSGSSTVLWVVGALAVGLVIFLVVKRR